MIQATTTLTRADRNLDRSFDSLFRNIRAQATPIILVGDRTKSHVLAELVEQRLVHDCHAIAIG